MTAIMAHGIHNVCDVNPRTCQQRAAKKKLYTPFTIDRILGNTEDDKRAKLEVTNLDITTKKILLKMKDHDHRSSTSHHLNSFLQCYDYNSRRTDCSSQCCPRSRTIASDLSDCYPCQENLFMPDILMASAFQRQHQNDLCGWQREKGYDALYDFPFPERKEKTEKGGQIRFTHSQSVELEKVFLRQQYISPQDRKQLSSRLKLSERQVKTWFQNRRAKHRRSQVETEVRKRLAREIVSRGNPDWRDDKQG